MRQPCPDCSRKDAVIERLLETNELVVADLNQAESNAIEFEKQRDLWKERTGQGSLIIEGNVAEIERLTAERDVWKIACEAQANEVTRLRSTNEYLCRWKEAEEKKQRNRP